VLRETDAKCLVVRSLAFLRGAVEVTIVEQLVSALSDHDGSIGTGALDQELLGTPDVGLAVMSVVSP
jgi:hypothetical protein